MNNSTKRTPKISTGYSLAELVIALACATILLAAAVPNIFKLQNEWVLLGSTKVLEASLYWGRMHAIASNNPLMLEVDNVEQKFYWVDAMSGKNYAESVRHLPEGIRFASTPRRSLRFYPRGNAAPAGTYTLTGKSGSYSVIVTPGGRIRTQRN